MINKYWDPKYDALIEQVHAWNALEGGYYEDLNLRAYKNYKWMDLSEAQMEEEIRRVQADLQKFFYCPICGRKSLLKDAVIKRKILNSSLKLDNAAMPGWMKINASSESCYMRLCPECAAKGKIRFSHQKRRGCRLGMPSLLFRYTKDCSGVYPSPKTQG